MRIAYISAGAGGMLCGSCMHDNTLAAALMREGHDVALVPCYTPMRTDEAPVSIDRVFYGAVSVWLESRYALFRRRWPGLDRLLDHPAVLRWVSRRDWSTSPEELGTMTLSVLRGEHGEQRKELEHLATWLADDFRPDVVHLTNSMFLGMAGPLRRATGAPVVCSVQGEDLFIDAMRAAHREEARRLMRQQADAVEAFVAPCRDHAETMAALLEIPAHRMVVVPLGLSTEGHDAPLPPRPATPGRPFTVGYMARMAPEKGFHLLAEAFVILARRVGGDRVRLRAAGHMRPYDRAYFELSRLKIEEAGLAGSFEYVGEVDRPGKVAFLRSLDVMSVPTVWREPKGLSILEAMANGVPVVQPAHGVFPDVLQDTGGGVLTIPGSAPDLAGALERLMEDPPGREAMGERGRHAVLSRYTDAAMARATLSVYRAASRRGSPGQPQSPEDACTS
ncbi:MAG: glycosyltransferase family 4 protein [Candidatus Polarisedimenticolia bacterium]